MKTREYDPQRGWYTTDANFRAYDSPAASTVDWFRLMNTDRYAGVLAAPDFDSAASAVASAGYATDPEYGDKLRRIVASTPEQRQFMNQIRGHAMDAGANDVLAELAARQAALESGWGRSAPGGNLFGIKSGGDSPANLMQRVDTMNDMPSYDPMDSAYAGILQQMLEPQPEKESTFMDRFWGNPMTQMGLGVLAAPGYGGNWLRSVGTGMLMGGQNYDRMEQMRQERSAKEQERQMGVLAALGKLQEQAAKPPTIEDFYGIGPEGETVTQKQWVPGRGWVEVGRGARWSPNQGMGVALDPETGKVTYIGPNAGGVMAGLAKPTINKLEENNINLSERMASLDAIDAGYDESYQTIENQLGSAWVGLKDRFGSAGIAEKAKYKPYWDWRAKTNMALNEEIKRITGAAMTEQEARRILGALPNPGSGVMDPGDAPTEFRAKLDSARESTKMALIRNQLTRMYGLDWRSVPLDRVESDLVDRYYDDVTKELIGRGLSEEQARTGARARISRELGF